MICSNCQTDNREGRKFCLRCGSALATLCPNCGGANEAAAAFCGECGTQLGTASVISAAPTAAHRAAFTAHPAPTAERRLVSVLFADLVGYTTIAEGLDPEDARELLGRYFAQARDVVDRYGGVVEKFIGDAVMAVWGTPTAHEDDAERAVRAALDLTALAAGLHPTAGSEPLALRAAVLTGEAAVTLGADGQGMVAGDLVNTASRLQSVAQPGTVLVGEATYRAASGAIAFEQVGEQSLKGRHAPVPAWRAVNVVALARGAGRSDRIEPPFVGRDAEFSALKERLHATSRDGRARLVSVTGGAGIGKSRLAWELEKYIDGLVEPVYWHHGRSPAYGDGLAFWALGEMVRQRAGIAESDDGPTSAQKIDAACAEWMTDDAERRWVASALRALLGLEETTGLARDELFAAWRTFFERIAERSTTVLVFEDLHWADPGLVDFIESILEWSRGRAILVVTLARVEFLERRPTWGVGQRDFTSLHLEPLGTGPMSDLVLGIAPGLAAAAVAAIVERAEGVPLYAVEFFRMLVDRGDLIHGVDGYEASATAASLDVPPTLQALIAARLDALPANERNLVQTAAVLGKTFTIGALAAVAGESTADVEPVLRRLVRRELLSIDVDPRSPERGQYGFVGALIREVAYGTLSRRDRRARHLAAARHFEMLGGDELAGILASHYTDAYVASHEGPEADAVATQARLALRGAAERSLALASPGQAAGFLRRALQVTTDAAEVARLQEDIANAERLAGRWAQSLEAGTIAEAGYTATGDEVGTARAMALVGESLFLNGQNEVAIEKLETALRRLAGRGEARLEVSLKGLLARAELISGHAARGLAWCDAALEGAAPLDMVEAIADGLVTRGWAIADLDRRREGLATIRAGLSLAEEHGLSRVRFRAINNIANYLLDLQPSATLELVRGAIVDAERLGDREWMEKFGFASLGAFWVGDWDLAETMAGQVLRHDQPMLTWVAPALVEYLLALWRGDRPRALQLLDVIRRRCAASEGVQDEYGIVVAEFSLAYVDGDLAGARDSAEGEIRVSIASGSDPAEGTYLAGLVAAAQGDLAGARAEIERLRAIYSRWELYDALVQILEGAIAARDGRPSREVAPLYAVGFEHLRRVGHEFLLVIGELDAVAILDGETPLAQSSLAHLREFAARNGSPVLDALVARALAQDRPTRPAGARTGQPQAGTPQNILTTS